MNSQMSVFSKKRDREELNIGLQSSAAKLQQSYNARERANCKFILTWKSKKMYIAPSSVNSSPARKLSRDQRYHSTAFTTVFEQKKTFQNIRNISEIMNKKIRSKKIQENFIHSNYSLDRSIEFEKMGFKGKKICRSSKFVTIPQKKNPQQQCTLEIVRKKNMNDKNRYHQINCSTELGDQSFQPKNMEYKNMEYKNMEQSRLFPTYEHSTEPQNQALNKRDTPYLSQNRKQLRHKKQLKPVRQKSKTKQNQVLKMRSSKYTQKSEQNTSIMINTFHTDRSVENKKIPTQGQQKRMVIVSYGSNTKPEAQKKEKVKKIRKKSFFDQNNALSLS